VSGRSFWNLYGLPIVMVAASIVTIVAVARRPDAGATDFKTFYQSSRQYLAGTDPYVPFDPNRGPNLNPPWVVAVMAQLGRAPLPVAAGVWWAVSFVCLFAAIALIARAVAPGHAVAIASSVLVTQAAYANLRLGQVAWPLMLLLTGAWLADRSRRPVLCGVLVGAAAAWKPFLLVFAPYLLFLKRSRAKAAAVLAVGIGYGSLMGYARIAQGAHFLSDIVWSFGIVYLTTHAVFYALGLHRARAERKA